MRFDRLAEHQIAKAQAEGQLDNLRGKGAPLPRSPGSGDAGAVGFRIMSESGTLPEEVNLRKAVERQRAVLQQTSDAEDRRREMRVLSDLQMRLAIQEEARRRFY
jgi:hypothetical protein